MEYRGMYLRLVITIRIKLKVNLEILIDLRIVIAFVGRIIK